MVASATAVSHYSGPGVCLQASGRSQPLEHLSKSIKHLTSSSCGVFGGFLVLVVSPGLLAGRIHIAVRSKSNVLLEDEHGLSW